MANSLHTSQSVWEKKEKLLKQETIQMTRLRRMVPDSLTLANFSPSTSIRTLHFEYINQ
jgi:hypothetical protein